MVERACKSILLIRLSSSDSLMGDLVSQIAGLVVLNQQRDGGWADVEETIWCTAFLKLAGKQHDVQRAFEWLRKQQLENGSWGYSGRDRGRIPITGVLLYLLPELATENSVRWLRDAWTRDLALEPVLSYKAAYVLMALSKHSVDQEDSLIEETVQQLQNEQNTDGGWGPWKNQPVGSSAEYSGIALTGLLQYPNLVNSKVIERAVNWLQENQLPSGLWPAHYIEEGSSWALLGLVKSLNYLCSV